MMELYCSKKYISSIKQVSSKHVGDFYCLNCLHFFRTKSKLERHKKVCEDKDFCSVAMLYKNTKILGFNQYQKSDKTPFIIFAEFESLIEKIDGCKCNPERPSTTKVGEHVPYCFSMSIIISFKDIENKHDVCRGKKIHENVLRILKRAHNKGN